MSNQKCTYVFKQGAKKGIKCGKPCRNKFCCDHNPKKKVYYSERFQRIQKANEEAKNHEKVNSILKMPLIDLPSLDKSYIKLRRIITEKLFIQKKLIGLRIFIGKNQDKEINAMEKLMFGQCTCCDMSTSDINEEQIEDAKHDIQITAYAKNDEDIKDMLLELSRCTFCDKYNPHNCKYCCRPNRIVYFPYTGKEEIAKKKIKRYKCKLKNITDKYKLQLQIIEALKKRYSEIKG